MKALLLITGLLFQLSIMAQTSKAVTVKKPFSRTTSIEIEINATPEVVYKLITDAQAIPTWTNTVVSIEGEIKEGEKIKLNSSLSPNRTFKLKVKEMEANKKLIWGDGMGTRVYHLSPSNSGGTIFSMTEKIASVMFPMFANKIPSFDASFEEFVTDLKIAAEAK